MKRATQPGLEGRPSLGRREMLICSCFQLNIGYNEAMGMLPQSHKKEVTMAKCGTKKGTDKPATKKETKKAPAKKK